MHPQSPPLTIGGTVLKESDDLDALGMTFDSKMTFDAFGVLSCLLWNTVLQCGVRLPIHTLNYRTA